MKEILAADQIGFPLLSALVVLPIAIAILLQCLRSESAQRQVALAGAILELALAVFVVIQFVPGTADIQFAERMAWMPGLGASLHFGVDGISVLFLPLTALVIVMTLICSPPAGGRSGSRFYLTCIMLFEAINMGIFVSLDLVSFFVFWELALIPSYFLIRLWGLGPQRQYAAMKYVMYMLVGSAPLLIAIIMLNLNYNDAVEAGSAVAGQGFDLLSLMHVPVNPEIQTMLFFLMIAAFAVKGPVPPFHTWMPTVLMEGPIGMAIILVGLKLGVYGMLRFVVPIMPEATVEWSSLMTWLAVASVLYGGAIALVQSNLRRLLAFASVSHVGLIVLGLFSLNMQSMQGSLILMLHVGLTATVLMFLVGALLWRTGSSELSAFGGIARQAPRLAVTFFVMGIASIGMPGTSGFLGEFMVLLGASLRDGRLAAVAVLGVILSAGYFLWYYERAFFGPPGRNVSKLSDLMPREFAMAAVMIALVFWAGVYPAPFLNITGGSVAALVEHVERRTGGTKQTRAIEARGRPRLDLATLIDK